MKKIYFESKILQDQPFTKVLTPLGRKIMEYDYFESQYQITDQDREAWSEFKKAIDCEYSDQLSKSVQHYATAEKLSNLLSEFYL